MPKLEMLIGELGDTKIYLRYIKGFILQAEGSQVDFKDFIDTYTEFSTTILDDSRNLLESMNTDDMDLYIGYLQELKLSKKIIKKFDPDFEQQRHYEFVLAIRNKIAEEEEEEKKGAKDA